MTVQVDRFNTILTGVRQDDGTYVYSLGNVEGVCSDPAGATPTAKAVKTIDGIIVPNYDGAQNVDALMDASLAVAKTASGAP